MSFQYGVTKSGGQPARHGDSSPAWGGRKPVILVVEDHEDSRFMLRTALTYAGYAVIEAAAANDVVKLTTEAQPDLILMDNHLGDADGATLTRAIRAIDHGRSPIVFLSGDGRLEARTNALAAGADAYFLKPISLDDLEVIVAQQLNGQRATMTGGEVVARIDSRKEN
ncbi:MAG TPA: response regulator transcription factor [Pyrinomonadaceae bacterium]|nr:response regulator transcription factor [Pyrinomonadaceae bacterium]